MGRKIQIIKFFGFPKALLFCAIAFQTKCFVSNNWICHSSLSGHHFLFVFDEWWWFFLPSGGDNQLFLQEQQQQQQRCLCIYYSRLVFTGLLGRRGGKGGMERVWGGLLPPFPPF